ncbi:AraC family transcriptional regulator [Promicromonospora sp. Populi]|uniref:AraC family transcriptional regulator n=1 Tax=Promicromonospora sp. Populi TaxID=3239420 RepID=UPI0034E2D163
MDLDQLRTLIDRCAPPGTSEPLPGISLCREVVSGPPETSTTGTVFALIAQGAKQLRLGNQTVDYGPGEYLVTSIDLPVIGQFTEASEVAPAMGFGMTLTASAIAELLLSADTPGAGSGPGARRGSASGSDSGSGSGAGSGSGPASAAPPCRRSRPAGRPRSCWTPSGG